MKKLLVLAALSMAAAPAMASKARLNSLGNAAHLSDTQTLFSRPADIMTLGDFATLEMGDNASTYSSTAVTRNPKAEGGFVRTMSWGKFGAYLGHRSETTTAFIDGVNETFVGAGGPTAGTLLTEQNPLDLFYGTELSGLKYGFDLHYSNSKVDDGTTVQKQSTSGFNAGVKGDSWDASLKVGLNGKTESDKAALGTPSLTSKGLYKLSGGYWFDSIYAYASYEYAKGTLTTSSDTDITKNAYEIGMVNNQKIDAGHFFYGVSYASNEIKKDAATAANSSKSTVTGLPLLVGMELDAASWLTLRGSVKQTVIVGENKVEATTNTKSNLQNDTTVAVGAGFKWNKIEIDGSVAGSTTGKLGSNDMLADASFTYMF